MKAARRGGPVAGVFAVAALLLAACATEPLPPPAVGQDRSAAPVKPAGPTGDEAHESFRPVGAAVPADPGIAYWDGREDLLAPASAPRLRPLPLPAPTRFTLANGLRVLVLPVTSAASHSTLVVRAGRLHEPHGLVGVAGFTAAALRRGTERRSAAELEQALLAVGARLDGEVEDEVARLDCGVAGERLEVCLELLSELVQQPAFPVAELSLLARDTLAELRERTADPSTLAQEHLANLVFGDQHPLGRTLTASALDNLTRNAVRAFFNAHYHARNAVLVVAAPLPAAEVKTRVTHWFSRWAARKPATIQKVVVPQREAARVLLIDQPGATRALVLLAQPTAARTSPQYPALHLLTRVFAGPDFASRLLVRLAVRMSLSSDVASTLEAHGHGGWFRVGFSTPPERAVDGLLAAANELRTLREAGVNDAELDAARGFEAGAYARALETPEGLAHAVAKAELTGRDYRALSSWPRVLAGLDAKAVTAVAAQAFTPDALVVVLVGDERRVAPALAQKDIRYERVGAQDPISAAERARRRSAERDADAGGDRGARALVVRALHEQGGAPRFRALRALTVVKAGERRQGDSKLEMRITTHYARPDRVRIEQTAKTAAGDATSVVVVDGRGVRGGPADQPPAALPAENVRRIRAALFEDVNFILINLLDAKPALPMQQIEPLVERGRAYPGLLVKVPSGDWLRLYFDPDTRLLARIRTTGEDGGITEEQLADYREVNGIKLPFRQFSSADGATSRAEIVEVKIDPDLPAALFP